MHPQTCYAGQIGLCHAKIENIPKKFFCHDQQRLGGHSCYEGGIEHMGGPPVPPPLGKTLQTMRIQSRAPAYGCVITLLLASTVSGDQCLHVEYNRLSFLISSIFLLKDSHLANFLLTSEFSRDTKL